MDILSILVMLLIFLAGSVLFILVPLENCFSQIKEIFRTKSTFKKKFFWFLKVIILLSILLALWCQVGIYLSGGTPNRSLAHCTACESNLKNIGTALEMYCTDNEGLYPDSTVKLVPNYLKIIPNCPAAGKPSYVYNISSAHSAFTIYCEGRNHRKAGISGPNYPQYTSKEGLIVK